MPENKEEISKKIYNKALWYLSTREHSFLELRKKLKRKFSEEIADINNVLKNLVQNKFQSDERFAEVYCRSKLMAGFGPVRIKQELKRKGIEKDLVTSLLENSDIDTKEILTKLMEKNIAPDYPLLRFPERQKLKAKVMRQMIAKGYLYKDVVETFNQLTKK